VQQGALSFLDRVGVAGALLAAIACPACFPIFATISAALGFGALRPFEGIIFYIFQAFVAVSVIGLAVSFRRHRNVGPLLLGTAGAAALGYAFYYAYSLSAVYGGLGVLFAASIWNRFTTGAASLRKTEVVLQSVLTCPNCGHQKEEMMPTNACLFFYDCSGCGARLKPKAGDCCVFCSYGSMPCPPIQAGEACCA
jgi:hypothetical protein